MDTHSHIKRWGAAYLLLALFLASWGAQYISMLVQAGNVGFGCLGGRLALLGRSGPVIISFRIGQLIPFLIVRKAGWVKR